MQSNIDLLNDQKQNFQNAIKEMKDEIINEMNIKYSKLLQQKIEEIHNTIGENVQKQNQTILENYIKKFNDLEDQRQLESSKFSQIIISDKNQMDIPKRPKCDTIHHNIECQQCFENPIIGFRYKCSVCDNYNLCEKCEEQNEISQTHTHDFIKIRNEEKEEIIINKINENINNSNNINEEINNNDINIRLSDDKEKEYSYEIINEKLEFFISNNSKNEIISIILKNNGNLDWPENETILICDTEKSLIGFNNIELPPIKKGHHETIEIELNIPSDLPFEKYKVFCNFNVKGKNYGNQIEIIANIVSELDAFRKCYNIDDLYTDQEILEAIQLKINWEDAFKYLINKE